MALSANSVFSQVLEDTPAYAVIELGYHPESAADETDVLKVNTASLVGRTVALKTDTKPAGGVGFTPGEQITGNTSGAIAYVTSWQPGANTLYAVYAPGSEEFSGTENVDGQMIKTRVQLTSVVVPTYIVDIRSIWYDVHGGKVELEWGDGAGFKTIITLSGQGYFGKNALGTSLRNNASAPNGNIYITTHGLPAHTGGYSIVLELAKRDGYAQRPVY